MPFHALTVQTHYFAHDGRGPTLNRWLRDSDLYLPDSDAGFAPFVGDIVGVQYQLSSPSDTTPDGSAWLIFHGLQVIQIVPEEVHSYWHLAHVNRRKQSTGVWEIERSTWIMTFHPRHLSDKKHFVLEFYDEVVEVICSDLIFGSGQFTLQAVIHEDPRFANAFLRYALAQEKLGNLVEAGIYFQKYINSTLDQSTRDYARRRLESLGSAQ